MKKILALVLALCMLLSLAACGGAKDKLPKVGKKVEGFVVQERRELPIVGATVLLFEHQRTGAKLVYVANNDNNRAFELAFNTRAIDNTGLPHVFEHATLNGSEKYPSRELCFNLMYQTYNTYMNAHTATLYTSYPVASLSEEQLLKYADYYTDSCLHPMILEDESIFREEAWRYRLEDMDGELTIEGTVYSEMKGAMNLLSSASNNILRAAFPGSTVGNESGGEPDYIPDMTWETLRSYHELYYHPSNCTAYLYGDFEDYTAFLKLLDEAFAPYEKRSFSFEDAGYKPLTESVTVSQAFPVEASSDTENASAIFYAFLCPGLNKDPQEELVLNTLTDLLLSGSSPLMQNLKKALPSGSFGSYIELNGPEDMICFYAINVNEADAETFRSTVDASLADIAANGFSDEFVDSVVSSLALSVKLVGDSSDVGVDLLESIIGYAAATGDVFSYMDYVDGLGKVEDWNAQGLYTKAISERLLACDVTVLCTTYPEAGAREALDAAEAERLAGVKASMSEAELQAVIDMTNAEAVEDDASEYVKALQAVTVSSLPEEIRSYETTDRTGDDGVRYITAQADVDAVGEVVLLLDASALPQEDIHWFSLYTDLVGQMDTAQHDKEALALLTGRYLYGGSVGLSVKTDIADGMTYPRLKASWIAEDEDLEKSYDLMYEVLFQTDFSDAETLQGLISRTKASLKSGITNTPYAEMLFYLMGHNSETDRYYSYFHSFEYYEFLEEAERQAQEDPASVAARLTEIADFFRNRENAAALYAGSEAGIEANAKLASAFMARLDSAPRTRQTYAFEPVREAEALIVDSAVQFNGVYADYETMGLDGFSGALQALASVVADAYLYPMLRDQYGVYSVYSGFDEKSGCYIVTYRDPLVAESFEAIAGLPDFLADMEITQEELDGYILSAYAEYAKSTGELSGAVDALNDVLTHDAPDRRIAFMRELKTLTPEALKAYAAAYEKMMSDGQIFTVGGASVINANADLYEIIHSPFGTTDLTEVELDDVPEGSEHYEAVRFAFENKLMYPAKDTAFGVDADATLGDMAIFLYALGIEDIEDGQEALDTLAEFGILPKGASAGDPLTAKAVESALASFSSQVGLSYKKDASAAEDVLTRGELAEKIYDYTLPLMG